MASTKSIVMMVVAFVAGALTIIAADALRNTEQLTNLGQPIWNVSKIIFAQCDVDDAEGQKDLQPRQSLGLTCDVEGASTGDNVIATFKQVPNCIDIESAESFEGTLNVLIENDCTINAQVGPRSEISLIVFRK